MLDNADIIRCNDHTMVGGVQMLVRAGVVGVLVLNTLDETNAG